MPLDPDFWNHLAKDYAAKPVENPEAFEAKIAITLSLMRPEHVVLDIGCGTGSLALRLAPHAAQVIGLDFSHEMLRIARDKANAEGAQNVEFHVGPFDQTAPFAAASLDGLCAYSLLHLVEDRDEVLARIFALLKPGGFFVSSTVCLGESWAPYGALLAVMRWVGKAPLVKVITKQTLVEELERAGFADIRQPEVGAEATIGFIVAHKPG